MSEEGMGANIARSALIIVDMQNDFLHSDGSFAHIAQEHPEAGIDMPFLVGTDPLCETINGCLPSCGATSCLRHACA